MTKYGEGVRPTEIAMTPVGEAWLYHDAPYLWGAVVHRQGLHGTVAATLAVVAARDHAHFQRDKVTYEGFHGVVTEERGFAVKVFKRSAVAKYLDPQLVAGVTAVRALATFEQGITLYRDKVEASPTPPSYRFTTPRTLAAFFPRRFGIDQLPAVHVTSFEEGSRVEQQDVGVIVPPDLECQLVYGEAVELAGAPPSGVYYDVRFDEPPHDLLHRSIAQGVEIVKLDVMARPELIEAARTWRPQ